MGVLAMEKRAIKNRRGSRNTGLNITIRKRMPKFKFIVFPSPNDIPGEMFAPGGDKILEMCSIWGESLHGARFLKLQFSPAGV